MIRGLHYQTPQTQAKLVRAVAGTIFDVAVDLRYGSPQFGKWMGLMLSAENKKMLWIPEGFAHGFVAISDWADVMYKATEYYAPQHEQTIAWNDPDLNIKWPVEGPAIVSEKDRKGVRFSAALKFK